MVHSRLEERVAPSLLRYDYFAAQEHLAWIHKGLLESLISHILDFTQSKRVALVVSFNRSNVGFNLGLRLARCLLAKSSFAKVELKLEQCRTLKQCRDTSPPTYNFTKAVTAAIGHSLRY